MCSLPLTPPAMAEVRVGVAAKGTPPPTRRVPPMLTPTTGKFPPSLLTGHVLAPSLEHRETVMTGRGQKSGNKNNKITASPMHSGHISPSHGFQFPENGWKSEASLHTIQHRFLNCGKAVGVGGRMHRRRTKLWRELSTVGRVRWCEQQFSRVSGCQSN